MPLPLCSMYISCIIIIGRGRFHGSIIMTHESGTLSNDFAELTYALAEARRSTLPRCNCYDIVYSSILERVQIEFFLI